jgi:hypothetical protein
MFESKHVGQVEGLYQSLQNKNDEHHFKRHFGSRFFQQCRLREMKLVATALSLLSAS